MAEKTANPLHSGYHPATRWLHAGLVLGVLFQLFCAVLMSHPEHEDGKHGEPTLIHQAVAAEVHPVAHKDDGLGELFMAAHRTGGIFVAMIVLANLLWAIIARGRSRKRQVSVLFSSEHWRQALSIARRLPRALLGKNPLPEPGNSLSLVFEMLGLLIMTAMAISGSMIWYLWAGPGNTVSVQAETLMGIHASVAIMLLFYLLGHISMALMHARAGDPVFARIFPVRKKNSALQGEKS